MHWMYVQDYQHRRHACIGPCIISHYISGKVNSPGVVVGDTIVWEYGGLKKTGKVVKVNPKTIEVVNTGATPFWCNTHRWTSQRLLARLVPDEFKVAAA